MLRDEYRFDAVGQPFEFGQMCRAHAVRRAERQSDAMQADWILGAHVVQHVEIISTVAEIVFAVDFQPIGLGMRVEKFAVVAGSQSDADAA